MITPSVLSDRLRVRHCFIESWSQQPLQAVIEASVLERLLLMCLMLWFDALHVAINCCASLGSKTL